MIRSNSSPLDAEEEIDTPVSPKTRQLADRLFAEIAGGTYRLGTRLPAERLMAEQYGLSRNTVRQALALLERSGIVLRRAGSGSVVNYRPAQQEENPTAPPAPDLLDVLDLRELGDITSPLELGVVRSIIEPEIARLAVLNMTSRDIEKIKEIQAEIDRVTVDGERFSALDDAFRMQLAEGTHNPLLVAIYTMINRVSNDAGWSVQRRRRLTPARIREYKLQNLSLCGAIESRDIESAVEFMRLSLAEFNQDLVRGA
ncbi:FadR/GntR family transcriptional regulator [Tabrizicola soli]|uniref:FadR/GntR family transcriptional regulator n=1 Tax=Tabrizicola soli TaxID=2185115 RepID=A0ABV7DWX9_9RHOB|nr:FCD domain-containing protein [Tabrizicola soli]